MFEDSKLTIPWTNTSFINLINGDDPYNAYLDITTYETDRETWRREVYIKATTVGGITSISIDPIHIDITIVETFNDREVNHAPQFLNSIPT
jgi:hypothetical protein